MNLSRRMLTIALVLSFLVATSGCATGEESTTTTLTALSATSTILNPSSPTPVPLATPAPLPITNITIDGLGDDWAERSILFSDPIGDAINGYLDIGNGFAFVNQDAIYLMLEVNDPAAPFVLFDMSVTADGKPLQITWQPNQTSMSVIDWSSGTGIQVAQTNNSQIAFANVLEGRIDLNDLQDPASIDGINVMAMANVPGQGWVAVDIWQISDVPIASERDSSRVSSNEERYVYARSWGLPEPYVAEAVYVSPLIYNAFIARTQNGTIYTTVSFVRDNGVSIVDPERRTATPILKLPTDILIGVPVGGPGDTLLLGVGTEVWSIHPDGSHEVWGSSPNAIPYFYTHDDRLIGATFDGRLVEIKPDGSDIEIASGFSGIGDVLVTQAGVILVYDVPSGDIIRVDPGGAKRVLVTALLPGDVVHFGMDFDGQVYFNPNGLWDLFRLNIETGQTTRIPDADSPCALSRGDIVFTEPGKFLLAGDQLSWSDLASGENGILVHGFAFTFAADIGADGALYIGASGCGDQLPARVLRINNDGTTSTFVDNLRGSIMAIGFAPDNGLYIASRDEGITRISYFAVGSQTPIEIPVAPVGEIASMAVDPVNGHLYFTVPDSMVVQEYSLSGFVSQHVFQFPEATNEFRLAFGPDGTLFGLAGFGISNDDFRGPWVLRLMPADDTLNVVAELSHQATGVMTAFTVDNSGDIWVIVNPDSKLFHISTDGVVSQFATNLPIDMPAIRVDPATGDIYFTVTAGIFRIFRESE